MPLDQSQIAAMSQAEKDSALFSAAHDGDLDVVLVLIEHQANPNKMHIHCVNWHNTLTIAIANNQMPVVLELLKNELVHNEASAHENLAFYVAAKSGRVEVVQALLKIDQVKNTANSNNNAALNVAAVNGYFQIVNILLNLEVVKNSLTLQTKELLHTTGFYTWQLHRIIPAIRAIRNGGMSFDIMLLILKDLYPGNSESMFRKQLKFVDNLPKDMGQFMDALVAENKIERLNHLLREGFRSELKTDTENLLKNKGYALNQNGQLVFSNIKNSSKIHEDNDDMLIDHDVNNHFSAM